MFNPLQILKMNFRFLEEDYDFIKTHEQFSPKFMGNAQIVYQSPNIVISIVDDRRQVFINIGSPTWPEKEWFEFTDVIHFFNPELEEVYNYFEGVNDVEERVSKQARRLAQILRDNCIPILRGDFSMASEIKEIEKKRVGKLLDHLKSLSPGKHNRSS